jgi:predicted ATPase
MDSIHIQGYKSIKDATIELKPINILIGANGSGKSNFLSFFEFVNRIGELRLQDYVALNGGVDKALHRGIKHSSTISASLEFKNSLTKEKSYLSFYEFELQNDGTHFIFTREYIGFKELDKEKVNVASKTFEAAAGVLNGISIIQVLPIIKKYHFHDTGKNSPFNQPSNIQNDIYFLYGEGKNIAAYLYSIKVKDPIVYKRILSVIQSVVPYFSDFYLEPNENAFILLQWRDNYSESIYGATDLSDGTIRFIALTVLFMQPNLPATIIIDEPELGLHPFAVAKLAGMIQSAAARGAQVIVATQSVELVSHFQPEDVLTVDQIDGESRFERLKSDDLSRWLETYSLGDLWKQNIIGKAQP